MNEIVLRKDELDGFGKLFEHCKVWCSLHQAEVGVAEMALGAAAVAWGVQVGHIQFGTDVVATTLSTGGLGGAAAGAGIGAIGAAMLGSIGVAGAFTFGIPAVVLAGSGMAILGAAGYGIGDVAAKLLVPPAGFGDVVGGASILVVGIALIVDGARRVVKDERILQAASKFRDGVIQLAPLTSKVVARTTDELRQIIDELSKSPAAGVTTGVTAAAGAAIGGSVAAASVTVLGSHGLGALALSLGLVSAPLWPVIAGGAAGLALGVAAWKGYSLYRGKGSDDPGDEPILLPAPDPSKGK